MHIISALKLIGNDYIIHFVPVFCSSLTTLLSLTPSYNWPISYTLNTESVSLYCHITALWTVWAEHITSQFTLPSLIVPTKYIFCRRHTHLIGDSRRFSHQKIMTFVRYVRKLVACFKDLEVRAYQHVDGNCKTYRKNYDVIKLKLFPRQWSFVWGIHPSPVHTEFNDLYYRFDGSCWFVVLCSYQLYSYNLYWFIGHDASVPKPASEAVVKFNFEYITPLHQSLIT